MPVISYGGFGSIHISQAIARNHGRKEISGPGNTRSPAFSRCCVTAAAPENSNNMSEIKTKATKSNISRDIWFSGKTNLTGANGGPSYYICEHIDNMHYFEDTKTFGPFCKFYKKPMAEVECGLDCPEFGYCASCGGFSAVRCQECDIIR